MISTTYYCGGLGGCTAEARDGNIIKNGLPTASNHVHNWIQKQENQGQCRYLYSYVLFII